MTRRTLLLASILLMTVGVFGTAERAGADAGTKKIIENVCCCKFNSTNGAREQCQAKQFDPGYTNCEEEFGAGYRQEPDLQKYCVYGPPSSSVTGCEPTRYDTGDLLPYCTRCGECGLEDFLQLFVNLYSFALHNILAPLAIFFFVVGSVVLLTAAGYSERIELGRNIISQTVAGVIIVLLSWVVIDTSIYLLTGSPDRLVFGKKWYGGEDLSYPCIKAGEPLHANCSGNNVTALQRSLAAMGYEIDKEGVYDNTTQTSVRQFQQDANSKLVVPFAFDSCSVLLWDQVFHTDWQGVGGVDTVNLCLVNQDNNSLLGCNADPVSLQQNTLPTNGLADTKTQELAAVLSSSSFAGEYQTYCLSTK